MIRRLFLTVICISFLNVLQSQDIHYSQFFNSPLNLNPALTGIYNGDARLHANYKNQWSSVPVDYTSADLGADFKLRTGNKGHFLGYGVLVNYDTAGDLNLGWTGANLFLSYSLRLSDKSLLTPGVTGGYYQRAYDQQNAITGSQWGGKVVEPTNPTEALASDNINFLDLGIGLNYRWQKAYRKFFDLGGSLLHINSPSQKFATDKSYTIDRPDRLSFYGMLNYEIHDDIDLLLNGLYSTQDEYQEIVANAQLKLYLGSTKDKALYLGAGYRFDDAWYPMIALEMGQFYGGFSYDLNNSAWDIASSGRGGPELSLRYIWAKVRADDFQPCLIF